MANKIKWLKELLTVKLIRLSSKSNELSTSPEDLNPGKQVLEGHKSKWINITDSGEDVCSLKTSFTQLSEAGMVMV
ncbi:hypothetical protein [Desulfonatronospira sp.]|uniref:hypothetical protein n=1 Tax=Desulfonatronospira sp. TaxID=1962951 RepID=UPI0025C13CE8|nr:hypothetical protein [Desulfonatronospira sp.]